MAATRRRSWRCLITRRHHHDRWHADQYRETLTVGAGSALGTVVLAGDGTIVGRYHCRPRLGHEFQGGTLSDVTYDGTLGLLSNNSSVYIANGLTANNLAGTGSGTIDLTGDNDTIYFEGNQTLNNATINLGNSSGYYDKIYNDDTNDTGSVLTLGPNVIVNQAIGETGYAEFYSAGYNKQVTGSSTRARSMPRPPMDHFTSSPTISPIMAPSMSPMAISSILSQPLA